MPHDPVQEQFARALDALVDRVKQDRSVLAAILCGSLAHDTVWERSDIDLTLVTVDDRKLVETSVSLYAEGLNAHAFLMPRAEFRKTVEGSIRNSFFHSFLAKGRLLYTHDQSLVELCARLSDIGERDTQLQLLASATAALAPIDKARKWFVTRGDLEYTAVWILGAATALARMELIGRRLIADREVLPQALALNPAFFRRVYTDLLNGPKRRSDIEAALAAIDQYLEDRTDAVFGPIIEYLREAGEARSASDIENHFTRQFNISGTTMACEYLARRGLIGKASTPVRLTRNSNVDLQELAFFYAGPTPDEY
jgi:predicted nucleotidyltransferase